MLASVALAVVLLTGAYGDKPTVAQESPAKPNFVFILADDMSQQDLGYMPKTRSLLGDQGMTFENAFVSNALCCPSRATIMRGQYAHNTGVWVNNKGLPEGGWQAYHANGLERDNVATRLDAAGYRTGLFGKYLNGHAGTYVPPGWDKWFANFGFEYFDYDINDNGTIRHFGKSNRDYLTDVLKRQTKSFIATSAGLGESFFAYISPIAPHAPYTPAPRHLHAYDGEQAARPPSFNEENVSDKPPNIRSRSLMSAEQIAAVDRRHEKRVETLQALDELVASVVAKLEAEGLMGNTYVFFTSDNGWSEGEHRRRQGKANPYEEDIHMPLLVRGPGVPAGSTAHNMVLNTDYLPTFTDLAGIPTPGYVDGRTLRPVLEEGTTGGWRSTVLLEGHQSLWTYAAPSHSGIRTSSGEKYVEYEDGFREYYDLDVDPYELTNSYDPAAPPVNLAARLEALKTCAADSCRTAENGQ